jgi:hypothetical protein
MSGKTKYNIEANYVISDQNSHVPFLQSNLEEIYHKKNDNKNEGILTMEQQQKAINELLEAIDREKKKTNDRIFLVSSAYDKIYAKYNSISLFVLILSSITTLLEAFRLTLVEFVQKGAYDVDTNTIQFVMNSVILTTGTIITILSSIVRFRNYRETLEQLKDSRACLINYRNKYDKKYHNVLNLKILEELDQQQIKEIKDKIQTYDNDIKSINILQYLRNKDILKFTKYKAYFDNEMKKIEFDKHRLMGKYENNTSTFDKFNELIKIHKLQKMEKHISEKNKADNTIFPNKV